MNDSPEVKEIKDDLDKYKSLLALTHQDGGKLLLTMLQADISADIETIMSLIRSPDIDLRCAVAKLKADLGLYRVLKRAEENVILAEDALKSVLETQKKD